jgi:type IV secretion system protein TrbF
LIAVQPPHVAFGSERLCCVDPKRQLNEWEGARWHRDERIGAARLQARNWRLVAFGNLLLAAGLASGLIWQASRGTITPWVVEVDRLGEAHAVSPAIADYWPIDPQIAWHLARFVSNVRSLPADPVIVRQNWLSSTDDGVVAAAALTSGVG